MYVFIKTHPRIVLYLNWDNRSWRFVFHTDSPVILHNSGHICAFPYVGLHAPLDTPTYPHFTESHGSQMPVWESSLAQTTTKSHTLPINYVCRLHSSSISMPFSLFMQNIQVTLLSKAHRTGQYLDHLCWFIFGINAWWWNYVFSEAIIKI